MKKQVLFVSAVVLSLTFASCGGSADQAKADKEAIEQIGEDAQKEIEATTEESTKEVEAVKEDAKEEIEAVKKDAKKDIKKKVKETVADVEKEVTQTTTSVKQKGKGDMEKEAENLKMSEAEKQINASPETTIKKGIKK